jgi:hypothetical protein
MPTIRGATELTDEAARGYAEARGARLPSRSNEKTCVLCEKCLQEIPYGKRGRGASGKPDLERIRKMAYSKG